MERNQKNGRVIGRYELLEEIGRGGMSIVFRALDRNLDREVALKLLHPHLASHVESRRRFQREARAVAKLKHSAVLEIYDYSDAEGDDVFIAMELVEGTNLRSFLDGRTGEPLSSEAAALLFREVGAALAHAHENGVVHRDVKPENILIGPQGKVKLSDFGIAHLAGLSQMTTTGQILGSPAYMSPEHIEQAELDARADVFSVGTVLYEMVVGRVPFEGQNPHAIIKRIIDGDFDDPIRANPAVGHHLGRIIRRCLAPDPSQRYASAGELVDDLDALLEQMGIGSIDEELALFFQEPETWIERRRQDVIEKTLSFGVSARRDRRGAEAMDHFNRVLALEPGNERALSAVAGMSRQRRARRLLERSILVAPLLVVVVAIVWFALHDDPNSEGPVPEQNADQSLANGRDAAPRESSDQSAVADAGGGESQTKQTPRSERLAAKPIPRTRKTRVVTFTPSPMAVDIVIDKKLRFTWGPSNRKRVLPVGKHTIAFEPVDTKRFERQTWNVRIPPGDTPFHFRERLRWRPAKLFIESNVKAEVTIPGRATDKVNHAFEVRLEKGPKEKVSLLVSAKGYIPRTKQVTIAAGELARIRVNLEKQSGRASSE